MQGRIPIYRQQLLAVKFKIYQHSELQIQHMRLLLIYLEGPEQQRTILLVNYFRIVELWHQVYIIILRSSMKQLGQSKNQANSEYTYTVTKVKDPENKVKYQKNLLIVNSSHVNPSEEQIKYDENSSYNMRPPSSSKKIQEDYVELPKINFNHYQITQKERRNSGVNIKLPDIEEQDAPKQNLKTNAAQESSNENDMSEGFEELEGEWANWNINGLKVAPSKNNYLESDYVLLPQSSTEKRKKLRKYSRQLEREMERRERQRNFELVSNFLSGKASMVWLFVLGQGISQSEIAEVKAIYADYVDYDYEIPVCRSYDEAKKFLRLQNCFFKVVVDVDLSSHFLEDNNLNKNVASIYIYNPKKIDGINRAFQLKKNLKKVKGMYTDLKAVTQQAQDDIENQAKFVKVGEQIEREKNKLRFPSFITLTGADSTDVTNYRLCLFGALKLTDPRERQTYLNEFTQMVELRYKDVEKELKNLKDYKKIDHIGENNQKKLREVLEFYVRETFYYILTNSILRLSRNSQEFRPCTIPFNETYHAIKHFYKKTRAQSGVNGRKLIVYRGAKLRNSDIKSLKVGSYIQLLGFTSTSLKKSEAEKFMDSDSYLFEITIENGARTEEEQLYDHGYVEINKYALASKAFEKEEQILINALNVFEVTDIDLKSANRIIKVKYGAILSLMRAKPETLSRHDKAVVQNYRYCLETFHRIQDDGDVLLLAQEHNRCVEYYQSKIEKGKADFRMYSKLANAQFESGDIDDAYNNALKTLERLELDSRDNKEIKKTVEQLKNTSQIFNLKEDMVHYQNSMDMCLAMLKDDWLQSARLLKEKSQNCLKSGDLATAKDYIEKAKGIIEQKQASFQERKKVVEKRYYMRSLCCGCTRAASADLQEHKQIELLKIQEDQIEFESRKDEICELMIEIMNVGKRIAEEMNDKEMYHKSVNVSQLHFNNYKKQSLNPIEEAKITAIAASVVDKHENMIDFETKMESAITLVKKQDPFHQYIGTYSNILGSQRQIMMKRKMQLSPIQRHPMSSSGLIGDNYVPVSEEDRPNTDKYNYEEAEDNRIKCRNSFKEAAENIAYNYGKEYPEYLSVRNKMSQLDLDHSRLAQSEKLLKETSKFQLVNFHSEGAKCYLLLTKIALAKGQLKNAFQNVEQSYTILRNTLLKVDNKQYNAIFVNNPLYIQINLHKAKIFNRQLKHDLALKQLKVLKKVAQLRRDKHHNSTLLASVFEEEAQIELCSGETQTFEEKILDAIAIRETQMGKYNIPNAVAYSNLFKYMLNLSDKQTAIKYHLQATEIFSRFPSDHPNFWVINLSNALIYFKENQFDKCLEELDNCIKVTNFRYSPSHIVTLKIDYQYASMLRKMDKVSRSIEMYKLMENILVTCLKEKEAQGQKVEKESDDEKFPLLKKVYGQMKQIHEGINRQLKQTDLTSILEVEKYSKNLKDINNIFSSASTRQMANTSQM